MGLDYCDFHWNFALRDAYCFECERQSSANPICQAKEHVGIAASVCIRDALPDDKLSLSTGHRLFGSPRFRSVAPQPSIQPLEPKLDFKSRNIQGLKVLIKDELPPLSMTLSIE